MLRKLFILLVLSSSMVLFAQEKDKAEKAKEVQHKFVGVKTCKMCHKKDDIGNQYEKWQNSKHANAYKALLSEKANKIAAEKGFKTPAAETPECLKCHTSGYDVDKELLGNRFSIEDGVQCETCHGAGKDYKAKKIMKNREEAIANGLIIPDKGEKFCSTCHNANSPTYKARDFNEMWEQIKHPIPKKEK